MSLIRCPECGELTVRGQPVEFLILWEYECRNGHVWRDPGPDLMRQSECSPDQHSRSERHVR